MSTTLTEQAIRPMVVPYYAEKANLPANILQILCRKMANQGLDREVLHNQVMMEAALVEFLEKEALTSIFVDMNGRFAGLAWLTNVEKCDTLSKGLGAFCFFREFWIPSVTRAYGEILLGHWFNILEMDLIYGITPVPNRLAQRYCRRLGFRYTPCPIPGFVSYHNETVDAVVCTMTRNEFNSRE